MERGKEGKNEEVRLEICEVEMEGKQGIHGGNQKEEGMGLLEEIETKQESSGIGNVWRRKWKAIHTEEREIGFRRGMEFGNFCLVLGKERENGDL